jgi:hypothetical protein
MVPTMVIEMSVFFIDKICNHLPVILTDRTHLINIFDHLYMRGKVLSGERKLHVLANDEQICWIVYDNEKKWMSKFLKKMFKMTILSGSRVYHYHAIIR